MPELLVKQKFYQKEIYRKLESKFLIKKYKNFINIFLLFKVVASYRVYHIEMQA